MRKAADQRSPETISERKRNSGAMAQSALPITEVLVVADVWQSEPDADAVIQQAIAVAA
jgi:probable rRNA maturation factor